MPHIPFDQLPPDARLWIFPAARALSDEEGRRVLAEADGFIEKWTAHGVPLSAGRDFRHDRFVLIGVDERAAGVSGCSVDALVRRMDQLGKELGVELVDPGPVLYRDGEIIRRVPRDQFADLASSGKVGLDTVVFDNTLTRVGRTRTIARGEARHARLLVSVRALAGLPLLGRSRVRKIPRPAIEQPSRRTTRR